MKSKLNRHYSLIASILLTLVLIFSGQALADNIEAGLPDKDGTSAFQVNDSDSNGLMKVQSNGNVGIGTTSPSRKLHVYEPTNTHVLIMVESSDSSKEAGLTLKSGTAGEWDIISNNTSGHFDIIDMSSDTTAMRITKITRNVGIGTTDPQGKLDVNGTIYQRGGQLHADYVFNPDYKLESIDEHSEFMWKQKHLKAVPKASVDDQGREIVEVGSHRKGILEELEKAHIYIDQLHQHIQTLDERLAKLEERSNTKQ